MKTRQRHGIRAGFTLIEVLAVIVIISLLAVFLLGNFGSMFRAVEGKLTQTRISMIEAALEKYSNQEGDYPPSVFTSDDVLEGGGANKGIECVYVALWSDGRNGEELETDLLENLDGDQSRRNLTDLPARDLFELVDQWGNPFAYFHHRDYGEQHLYLTLDAKTGEEVENYVVAFKDGKTQDWYERRSFQLISAGPDGRFGGDDDIANFKFE